MRSQLRFVVLFLPIIFAYTSCNKKEPVTPSPIENGKPDHSNGQMQNAPLPKNVENCAPKGARGAVVQGQYIVLLNSGQNGQSPAEIVQSKAQQVFSKQGIDQNKIRNVFSAGFDGFTAVLSDEEHSRLTNDPEVLTIEADRIVELDPYEMTIAHSASQQVPYGIKRVGGPVAANSRTAWVMDTGIDMDHPDLNIDRNRSRSFVCDDPTPQDENGHGTHVAGTIGAIDNHIGVVGVAAGAKVVALKVMGASGKGTVSNIIAALDHVYRHAAAGDVVNMSLSGGQSDALDRMVKKVSVEKRIYFAVAAGNDAKHAGALSPQRVVNEYVFTISAMDQNDNWASFSNFGAGIINYCAPGVRIASTHLNGSYAYLSGTSMATPHVAGLLLMKGRNLKTDGFVNNDPDGKPDPIAVY